MDTMTSDVFRVSLVVDGVEGPVAELAGFVGGQVVEIGDPVKVPAVVLAQAAGVGVEALPGMEFAPSGAGWVPVDVGAR